MSLLENLSNNKGTVSSALGKELAAVILAGNTELLDEALPLASYKISVKKEKNIRAGAAKIVELVAEKKPELVAPYLEILFAALTADEPQTRWMMIRTMGYCAKLNQKIAQKAIPYAKKYIREKVDGQLCLVSAADRFLGDYGKISKECSAEIFPILLESADNAILNEHDWILESFIKIAPNLSHTDKNKMLDFAENYINHNRKTTQARILKLKQVCR